jgi:protein-disulfide isomerase/uncharacterized membrane protein
VSVKKKEIKPLPFPYYGLPVVFLSLAGLGDSIYLALSHYRNYTDIGYASFCAISRAINCDTVSQSPYAIFGGVPVAVWGALGYLIVLLLSLYGFPLRAGKRDGWGLLFLISWAFSGLSLVLAAISTFYIHSYCIMCILSYAINLMLVFYCWLIRRRFKMPSLRRNLREDLSSLWHHRVPRFVAGFLFISCLVTVVLFPPYWQFATTIPAAQLQSGETPEGHPWIGASDPKLEITEFTDYRCFQCRKMHFFLRNLVSRYPDRIRLIHRHFPMDREVNPLVKDDYHAGAARMALLAIYAEEKGHFWKMNDALYGAAARGGNIDLALLAEEVGFKKEELSKALTETKSNRSKLIKDVWDGLHLGVTGTPTFIIDGEEYVGQIPPEILRAYLK